MAKPAVSTENNLSLKVTLRGIRPPIWRRLMVPAQMTLGDLHRAIQEAMGWENSHLHVFEIAGREYGDPDPEFRVDGAANETRMTLAGVVKMGVNRFSYVYDFGDNWEHTVLIEKRPPAVTRTDDPLVLCVAGKRNCPPEDCGGIWGYQALVAILADPTDPRHNEWKEMYGDDFDSEDFFPDIVNAGLAARLGRL